MTHHPRTVWAAALLAAAVWLSPSPTVWAQTPAADYQLQNVYTSSVGNIGPLTVINAGGVAFTPNVNVNGNNQYVLSLTDGTSGTTTTPSRDTSGVQTQTAGFISSSNYSIAMLANFTLSATLVATKIFDFKNLSADAGLYVNDTTGLLSFNGAGTPPPIGGTPVISGAYTQIVLTRSSATNLVSVYQAGALAFSFTDTNGLAVLGDTMATSMSAYLSVFKDDNANLDGGALTSETTAGNIARLRLYDGALTADQLANLTSVIPEPSTWAFLAGGGTLAILVLRRRQHA